MIRHTALLLAILALPIGMAQAQARPRPTKVVTRSERLVTARTSDGGTLSYNCRKPENARRKVCRR